MGGKQGQLSLHHNKKVMFQMLCDAGKAIFTGIFIRPQWDILSYPLEWQQFLKSCKITSTIEAREKLNFSYTAAGSTICYNYFGKIV